MGTEIAIPVFGPLIIVGVAILIFLVVTGRNRSVSETSTLGIGRRRLALGYLGVLGALLLYSYWDTVDLRDYKVAEGHVKPTEADGYFWGWYFNLFCLITPFIFFFLTVLGLPLLKGLRHIGLLSVAGALLASQLLALAVAIYGAASPGNDWCRANVVQCGARDFLDSAPLLALVAVSFGLASRLPVLRGSRHVA